MRWPFYLICTHIQKHTSKDKKACMCFFHVVYLYKFRKKSPTTQYRMICVRPLNKMIQKAKRSHLSSSRQHVLQDAQWVLISFILISSQKLQLHRLVSSSVVSHEGSSFKKMIVLGQLHNSDSYFNYSTLFNDAENLFGQGVRTLSLRMHS